MLLLTATAALYFGLFFFPNLTGARDENMLQVFEVDEYAQYSHVIDMLTPGDTFYITLRHFLIYLHYFYGYPFYFFSALALLPVKLVLGSGWTEHTQILAAVLRQMINVLPALLGVGLLVWVQTRFKDIRAWGLLVFLLAVPGLVVNNLWWHPDSLGLFFVALVFFLLEVDNQRFGRYFFLAAAACGVAFGIKYLGAFFVLAAPLYILWGAVQKSITWKRAAGLAALFVLVMAAALVISNPLLLLPQERAAIIEYQKLQFQQTNVGVLLKNTASFMKLGEYPEDFRQHYGEAIFLLVGLISLGVGLARRETRLRSALVLAWLIPAAFTILNAATRRTHYFIPVILPLYACLFNLVDLPGAPKKLWKYARLGVGLLAAIQMALFLRTDALIYTQTLNREQESASIQFYRQVEKQVLPGIQTGTKQPVVYRDWRAYFPANSGWRVEINWDLANEDTIRQLNPDLILLERENAELFSSPEAVAQAVNPEAMELMRRFYGSALENRLSGYRLVYQDAFGLALVKNGTVP